jgi:hypothetical protein
MVTGIGLFVNGPDEVAVAWRFDCAQSLTRQNTPSLWFFGCRGSTRHGFPEAAASLVWFLLILIIHVPCTFLYPFMHGLYAPMIGWFSAGTGTRVLARLVGSVWCYPGQLD